MRLSYYEEQEKKLFFLSLCVKLLLLRKDEESFEWYATGVLVCVGGLVGGEKKRKEKSIGKRTRKGGVVKGKEGDRFVLFFFSSYIDL